MYDLVTLKVCNGILISVLLPYSSYYYVLVITQLRVPYTRYGTVVTYKARVPQARVLYVTTVPYMVYGHEQLCNN